MSVHPHRRGEHEVQLPLLNTIAGSSPQTRGTRIRDYPAARRRRFIPTDAGNTCHDVWDSHDNTVHPHRRGEHFCADHAVGRINGSSPQTRGTLLRRSCGRTHQRFIPTDAGNTGSDKPSSLAMSVHPHRRGEHILRPPTLALFHGSSPQTRGTLEAMRGDVSE